MSNTLLRPLVNAINRLPIDEKSSEAVYEVRVTADIEHMPALRELLVEKLEAAKYPVSDTEVVERPDDTVEIVAVLTSTSVDAKELDAVTAVLSSQPGARHATWETRSVA